MSFYETCELVRCHSDQYTNASSVVVARLTCVLIKCDKMCCVAVFTITGVRIIHLPVVLRGAPLETIKD